MIGIVDVEVQAANPQMPLCPFVAFVGSPSSVRVRNVPGNVGSWNITKVYVSANYPDNSIQSRECTRVGEIYVGTLPACNAVGKGANGFVVSADGVDESGNAVTGYVLGKGDLEILDADGAITPGVTTHYVHGLDEQPSDPHEYDIYKDGDTWKIYFNGAWGPLAPAPATLDDAVTRTSANGVKSSGIWSAIWGALSALPTGFTSLYDWCVAKLRDKLDLAVYGLDNATVALPDGFSITFYDETYTAPVGGETITFIGPVPSSNPSVPNRKFYYPSSLGTLDSFDPNDYSVWCLVCLSGGDTPEEMMYKTGPLYSISGWNSSAPTLTLSYGEATGDAPTMTRTLGATGDTLAKASQLAGKLDKSGGTVTGEIYFGTQGVNDQLGLVYDGENKRLTISDGYNENTAYLEVPNTADGSRVAFVSDVNNAIAAIPYALGTPIVIDSESVQTDTTDPDNPITYAEVTLANRTANIVQIYVAIDELRVTLPAATDDKMRDFELEVGVGDGTAALAAPALSIYPAEDEDIALANPDGAIPELADGTATLDGSTVLYFTEFVPYAFLVKGEQLKWI